MSNSIKTTVNKVIRETADAITIVFDQPEIPFTYKSGQFLTLIADINGEEVRRAYSLCSSAYNDELPAVTVKRVDGGKMSNYLNDNTAAGQEMRLLEPMGFFQTEPDATKSREVVLFGGGSGITPLFSILKTVLLQEPESSVTLIFANTSEEAIIFKSQLAEWGERFKGRLRIVHYLDNTKVEVEKKKKGLGGLLGKKEKVSESQGFLTTDKLNKIINDLGISATANTEAFMCGPGPFMNVVEAALASHSFAKEQVHKESFVAQATDTHEVKTEGTKEVTLIVKGEEHKIEVKEQSILFEALEQGIDISFSCQAGLCTACMGKCTSGKVEMEIDDALSDSQIKEGYVLTCVGHPVSDDVVIEFD